MQDCKNAGLQDIFKSIKLGEGSVVRDVLPTEAFALDSGELLVAIGPKSLKDCWGPRTLDPVTYVGLLFGIRSRGMYQRIEVDFPEVRSDRA